jgi:cell division septum initiation protein DivIVA
MRLTVDEIKNHMDKNMTNYGWYTHSGEFLINVIDTTEALQQENKSWQERYEELDAGHSRLFKDFCKLQQEIQQLQAQNAAAIDDIKHALAVNRGCPICKHWNKADPLLPWCKIAKAQANCFEWRGVSTTYHNPADVEALAKATEALKSIGMFTVDEPYKADRLCKEALAAIEKAGGEK